MLFKRYICLLISFVLMITAAYSAIAIAENTQSSMVQATANVNVRTGPGTSHSKIGSLLPGETVTYLNETVLDNRGVAWYSILFNGNPGWVSAKYGKLLSESIPSYANSPLADYPHFYEGYIFELSGVMQYKDDSDEPANGCNANDDMVDWVIDAYCVQQNPENGEYEICPPPELVFCSWTDEWISVDDEGLQKAWPLVNEGKTATDTNLYYHWPDEEEIRTYTTSLYLPDDPSIEGAQQIIYYLDDLALVFDFNLNYNGGYTGYGMGWEIRNVVFSKHARSEFESSSKPAANQESNQTANPVVNSNSPLADYEYYHDGYVFEISGLMQYKENSEEPANGCNANDDMVNWLIDTYCVKQDPETGEYEICPPPELIFCSWTNAWISYKDSNLDAPWNLAKDGKTSTMTGLYYHWPDDQEIRTYSTQLFLPDDPSLEGPQRVSFQTEENTLTFDFTLDYNGGYSGYGMGWDIRNVECTISESAT